MADPQPQTVTINPPEGFQYEAGKPIQVPLNTIDFKSVVPKEYADKEYLKTIDGIEPLFKTFDGLQSKSAEGYKVPAADAPQEEWDKYFEVTRPGKPDEYEFVQGKDTPEELKSSPEFQSRVKAMFHEAGITKKQAAILQSKWDSLMLENFKGQQQMAKTAQEKMDKDFDDLMKQTFGDSKDQKIATARAVMVHLLGQESPHLGLLNKATNEQLVAMTQILAAVKDKYISEDELPKDTGKGGSTLDDLKLRAHKLRQEEDEFLKKNETTAPRLNEIRKELADVSQQIAKVSV